MCYQKYIITHACRTRPLFRNYPTLLKILLLQILPPYSTVDPLFVYFVGCFHLFCNSCWFRNYPTLLQSLYLQITPPYSRSFIFVFFVGSSHLVGTFLLATITPAESAIINSFLLMCFLFSASKQHHRLGSCHLRIIDVKIYQHF